MVSSHLAISAVSQATDTCPANPPASPFDFGDVITLGLTRPERDILYNCCHTQATTYITIDGNDCFQKAACKVDECSLRDPTFACIAVLREDWKIDGPFTCTEGIKERTGNGAVSIKSVGKMNLVGLVVAIAVGVLQAGGV